MFKEKLRWEELPRISASSWWERDRVWERERERERELVGFSCPSKAGHARLHWCASSPLTTCRQLRENKSRHLKTQEPPPVSSHLQLSQMHSLPSRLCICIFFINTSIEFICTGTVTSHIHQSAPPQRSLWFVLCVCVCVCERERERFVWVCLEFLTLDKG